MTTSSSAFAETADLTESLVQRIGAGDTAAENELVAHFRRGLFFVLRRECGDSELAQDITQDTLEKVIRNARDGKIQKPRALTQYIRHVGVYQLIDYRRKEKRRKTDPSADIADQTPTADQSLLEQVDGQQIAELVRALLEEMTVERDKEVLRRFYLIGQDKATIAAEFDITLDHFDRVKSRALLRLRKLATENLKARGLTRSDVLGMLLAVGLVYLAGENGLNHPNGVRGAGLSDHFTEAWRADSARAVLGSDRNPGFG